MWLHEGLNQTLVVDVTTTYDQYDFHWECGWKVNNVIQFWLHPSMDDKVVVFAITMKGFAIAIIYSTTCTNKHKHT